MKETTELDVALECSSILDGDGRPLWRACSWRDFLLNTRKMDDSTELAWSRMSGSPSWVLENKRIGARCGILFPSHLSPQLAESRPQVFRVCLQARKAGSG